LAALVLAAIFAAIYVPALGHGFVKDDFRWIAAGDVHSPGDLRRIFTTNVGFYRPLVTSSFAIDRAAWGLDPRGYAFTNLLLLAADAALLFLLATRLSLPAPAALFAVAVWAFNFHGINMALLWTSGRTALLLCLFAQASMLALLRGHRLGAGVLTLAAMLCKEEAVMLPALLTMVVMFKPQRIGLAAAFVRCWPLWLAAGLYALLREQSGAFGVSDAPAYYHLVVDPRSVLKNVTQYLDRGATVAALATIAVWMAAPHQGARLSRSVRCGSRRCTPLRCSFPSGPVSMRWRPRLAARLSRRPLPDGPGVPLHRASPERAPRWSRSSRCSFPSIDPATTGWLNRRIWPRSRSPPSATPSAAIRLRVISPSSTIRASLRR
jgi:hypothetical protein